MGSDFVEHVILISTVLRSQKHVFVEGVPVAFPQTLCSRRSEQVRAASRSSGSYEVGLASNRSGGGKLLPTPSSQSLSDMHQSKVVVVWIARISVLEEFCGFRCT